MKRSHKEKSQRKAVIQPAHEEAPRPVRKNRLRNPKTTTSSAQSCSSFGASICSIHGSRMCAEQNHLREKIEKIAKSKNRMQGDSVTHHIASV
jgi:hypothetical protein